MLVSSVLPITLGLTLSSAFPDWSWSHYPFHSMLESVGSLSALTIATLMIIMIRNDHLSRHYIIVACALIGMGILDGFHAILHASVSFVWLHSIATMVGGIIFAAVWMPEQWLTEQRQKIMLLSTITVSLLAGFISIIWPEILPTMIIDGNFSLLAKIINIAGGIGFLVGTAYFSHAYYINIRENLASDNEQIIFANHCLLFGIAGLLFETSVLWDAGWWWWHILRFMAYLVVLIYFFSLFKRAQDLLKTNEAKLEDVNKDLEERVKIRTLELEKASQAKTDFLSRMSHELRTPLNAILGFGQLLKMDIEEPLNDNKTDDKIDNVNEILVAGDHLLNLINEILDLTRIESGRLDMTLEAVPITALIESCAKQLQPQAADKNITINFSLKSSCIVKADHTRLKQVMYNLLSNAVKYNCENGEIHIQCSTFNPDYLRISISDTGNGLSDEQLQRLFKPFERLESAYQGIEGTGIGLALSKILIEGMNGTIGVNSTPGLGSNFWFELPIIASK